MSFRKIGTVSIVAIALIAVFLGVKLGQVSKEKAQLAVELASVQSELLERDALIASLSSEIAVCGAALATATQNLREMSELHERDLEVMNARLASLSSENALLADQVSHLEVDLKLAYADLSQLQTDLDEALVVINGQKLEIAKKERKLDEASQKVGELTVSLAKTKADLKASETKVGDLTGQLATLSDYQTRWDNMLAIINSPRQAYHDDTARRNEHERRRTWLRSQGVDSDRAIAYAWASLRLDTVTNPTPRQPWRAPSPPMPEPRGHPDSIF